MILKCPIFNILNTRDASLDQPIRQIETLGLRLVRPIAVASREPLTLKHNALVTNVDELLKLLNNAVFLHNLLF